MPLKYRIAGTIFLLEVALVAALLWVTLSYSMNSVRNQVAESEQVVMQLFGDLSRSALLTEDYAELQVFIERSVRDPRIAAVIVADIRGRIAVASEPTMIGKPLPPLDSGDHYYWQEAEVTGRSNALGRLAIQFSDHELIAVYQRTRIIALIIAGCGILLTAVASIAIGYMLTGRLRKLAEAADGIAAGGTGFRLDAASGRDEVARLARALASMVERLQQNLRDLKQARDLLILPTEAMSQGFALWDANDRLVLCNRRFRHLFHEIESHLAPGTPFATFDRLYYSRMAAFVEVGAIAIDAPANHRTGRKFRQRAYELHLWDGRWLNVRESRTGDGGIVAIYTDVTQDKQREHELRSSEQRLREIMAAVSYAIITVDAGDRIESVNPAAVEMFGWAEASLVGRPIGTLLFHGGSKRRSPYEGAMRLGDLAHRKGRRAHEMRGLRRTGEDFPVEIQVATVERQRRRTLICTIRDITDRKAAEERLLHHATHDHLTGLPNRALFHVRLGDALAEARRTGERLAVMYLDLDRFKNINDNLGHPIGDALLASVAQRLRHHLRITDTVARLGGDEFIFVFPRLERVENALQIGHKIVETMRASFEVLGHRIHVTASVGISLFPDHGNGEEQLLSFADIALYQAKAWGKDRVRLFDPSMEVEPYREIAAAPAGGRAHLTERKRTVSAAE